MGVALNSPGAWSALLPSVGSQREGCSLNGSGDGKVELIAQGSSLEELLSVNLPEGQTGELRLYLDEQLSEGQLQALQDNLLSQGLILLAPLVQISRIVSIKFRKEVDPMLIIVSSFSQVAVGILGWQLLGMPTTPTWVWLGAGLAGLWFLSWHQSRRKVVV